MEVSWPNVRQVVLNDRVNGYKPDRAALNKIAGVLPDARVIGFGKYYEYHWYVILESKSFPASIEPLGTRGSVPFTALIKGLAENRGLSI